MMDQINEIRSILQEIPDSVFDDSTKTDLQSIADDLEGYCDEF